MRLRVFLPPSERIDAATRAEWTLFDARGKVLREDATALDAAPRADDVEAIVPASRVLFARLALPKVNAATIRELLPYAVEDRLVADPAHIHAVAGRRDPGGETTVAVVDRNWLAAALDTLARTGLKARRAWSESALTAGLKGEWHLVWGPQRGFLVDDRDVSVAFDRGSADALPLALRIALDEAAQRGERPQRIVLHAEKDAPLPDVDRWRAESGATFASGEAWESVRIGAPSLHAIDLMQGEFSGRSGTKGLAHAVPRAAVVIAAVIAVAQLAFVAIDAWRLEQERKALEARAEALFRSAFPEARTVVDPELQMRRNLAELRRARGVGGGDDFLAQLTRAARESSTPAKSIEYANGRLAVQRAAGVR